MAVIQKNENIKANIYHLIMSDITVGDCGQFYMIKPSDDLSSDPILLRPISIFDGDKSNGTVSMLYQAVGRGTELLSKFRIGDTISTMGPLGNAFPLFDRDIVLIGGGIGIAPLYYLAKSHREKYPNRRIDIYLGFRDEEILHDVYTAVCDELHINIGGFVTDDVDFTRDATYYACGPTPMMKAGAQRAKPHNADLYVSLENRMACGVGACLACTCKTTEGNRRVCKDGPIFLASEVFYE